jgi:hypothetical protein
VAAGACTLWLVRGADWLPRVSSGRTLCLMVVCAYLVSATLLLFDDR